eukprot:CAMPEP_0175648976 /NCGR_PEP_ID=MMETSP0097-20121207/8605_1 /TAXON_ID=311494 /ORGANISM="Alexandrium monilatum, Strain CCMP3105" /LENGTH=119 /DNA_ID=CAMNT_0016954903 /DNA_START=118 /DNA_END=477 /DNA_ORIENTATION=+
MTLANFSRLVVVDVGHEELLALSDVLQRDRHGRDRSSALGGIDVEVRRTAVVRQRYGLDQAETVEASADLDQVHGPFPAAAGSASSFLRRVVLRDIRAGVSLTVLPCVLKAHPGEAESR